MIGMSYGEIASRLGTSEQHVIDGALSFAYLCRPMLIAVGIVCTGAKQPTQAEFEGLARVLDITGPVSPNTPHAIG